jgi:DNA-binding PadR family transcriptional regulator
MNIGGFMDAHQTEPNDFPPLTPAIFLILLSLVDEERHGYGIMKEVEARTDKWVQLKPGTLYQAIKRLLDSVLIEETGERVDPTLTDERRRYYRLTGAGREVLQAEAERLARMVDQAAAKQVIQRGEAKISA